MSYLFALDPSLTSSGWALFCLKTLEPKQTGALKSLSTKFTLEQRLADLQRQIAKLYKELKIGKNDFFICEGPAPLILNPNSSMKVERVRGVFETLARESKVKVLGRINPRTVQAELMGLKGKQIERKEVKRIARDLANKMFSSYLKENKSNQDIIDAILIGALVSSKLKLARDTKMDLEVMFSPKQGRTKGRSKRWKESDIRRLQLRS